MLGVSSNLIASTTTTSTAGDGAAISTALPPQEAPESGGSSEGGGGGVGDMSVGGGGFSEEGERNSGGNRWPRQETLALLKIRSEMDVVFKDSSLKGPLWEEVSRKMADLGYHRSAKKCKEKFENVSKYHRRTKEGRASKADGKTYRFFDQLQALENNPVSNSNLPPSPLAATPITMAMPMRSGNASVNPSMPTPQNHTHPFVVSQNTVVTAPAPATTPTVSHFMIAPVMPLSQPQPQPHPQPQPSSVQPITNNLNQMNRPQGNTTTSFLSNSTSSSSTSSDEDIQRRHSKKRKWKEFFESLMKDVIEKQEELQKKFLETLEKRERDRLMREETWRVQEMARLNREHDLLVQERSMAAAKDATIIAFLQKITEQQNTPIPNSTNNTSPSPSPSPAQIQLKLSENPLTVPPQAQAQPPPAIPVSLPMTIHTPVPAPPQALSLPIVSAKSFEPPPKTDNGGDNFSPASSSRWPKEEIEALISLRTCLDLKYQENGPKGPLWEEISSGMRKIGYNRNAKRCKEKWENINKYFKKVKESNKKRPEDSKTCPYFHQLEALYKEKAKNEAVPNTAGLFGLIKPENNTPIIPPPPIMAQPEQQWPIPPNPQSQQQQNQNQNHHDNESDNNSMDQDEEEEDEDDYDEEDEGNNGYEIVTNKQQQTSSMAASTVTTTVSAAATATTAV